MKDFLMAWRNLWRNKRRTLITAASVFFAVFFALVMRSFQLGTYDRMFKNIIESYTGYLQIQNKDYFDEPILDNSFQADDTLLKLMLEDPRIIAIVPRLESFALAAAGSRTQGVIVMGIDPEGEHNVSGLKERMVSFRLDEKAIEGLRSESVLPQRIAGLLDIFINESYPGTGRLAIDLGIPEKDTAVILPLFRKHASVRNQYFSPEDSSSVLIGHGLSRYLGLNAGDTLVLLGQGYHGTSAAGKYVVKGILKLPAPDVDNLIVYIPVNSARELYSTPGMSTSAVIRLVENDDETVDQAAERLRAILPEELTVKTWRDLNALMINQMEADNKSGIIMIGILYLVIAFGVFGTVLMMLSERRREFGMLVSIGMQKKKLAKIISLELLLVGFLGIASGVIAALPVVIYGNFHPLRFTGEMARMYEDYGMEPVMPTLLPDTYFLWQTVVVLIILSVAIGFSVRRIFSMNVINSLRA